MTDKMDKRSTDALVAYRLQRSAETMKEAEMLFKEKHYNATINRLYYACYYAVSALLLKHNITAQTHSGLKAMLGLHFVSKGAIDVKTATTYYTLFEKRQSGDYDDFIFFEEETTENLMNDAKYFTAFIQKLIYT